MIEELKVSGFRSLKDVTWRPGRLNVVIGPNGSGKSNLLRVLEMLSESAKGRLDRYIKNEGSIDAILWDGQVGTVALSAEFGESVTEKDFTVPPLHYELSFSRVGKASLYQIDKEYLVAKRSYYGVSDEVQHIQRTESQLTFRVIGGLLEQASSVDDVAKMESSLSQLSGPMLQNHTISETKQWTESWRIYDNVSFGGESEVRGSTITRYETQIERDAQNLISVLHTLYTTDRDFKQTINKAMTAAFGQDFEELTFPPSSSQRIQMHIRWKTLKREQPTVDLSDGTLRFLFLATVLANPNLPPLIAIDEPETGLHPSMLPLIAELAVNASLRSQVIFTTHSDQFLDAFNEAWEKPTVTVAKWENGETSLATIDGEELQNWLNEFSLGSMYRSGELESGLIG